MNRLNLALYKLETAITSLKAESQQNRSFIQAQYKENLVILPEKKAATDLYNLFVEKIANDRRSVWNSQIVETRVNELIEIINSIFESNITANASGDFSFETFFHELDVCSANYDYKGKMVISAQEFYIARTILGRVFSMYNYEVLLNTEETNEILDQLLNDFGNIIGKRMETSDYEKIWSFLRLCNKRAVKKYIDDFWIPDDRTQSKENTMFYQELVKEYQKIMRK